MLTIKNLSVSVGEKEILKDFNLTINEKEVHAIMGPNGIGKSTICKTIMGDPNYIVTSGSIIYNNTDLISSSIPAELHKYSKSSRDILPTLCE